MNAVNSKPVAFVYDDPALMAIERSLSKDRLAPYLQLAEGDKVYAIQLYEWNTRVSESLYSLIQGFEVTLRNTIHNVLSEALAQPDWWEACGLKDEHKDDVDKAAGRIYFDGKEPNPGRIVAELMFGFWVSLFGTDYAQNLYDAHLHKCFPNYPVSRKEIAKRLKTIRFLRNRVAHHESIIGKIGRERNLRGDVQNILLVLSWICPTTAKWVSANSTFDSQYERRPQKPPVAELFDRPGEHKPQPGQRP
jgi:hypothetical protein